MIVFDLSCAAGDHRFEAWFASSASYADQRESGLIGCPVCGDTAVTKAVMAPYVGAKGNRQPASAIASLAALSNSRSSVAMATEGAAAIPAPLRRMMADLAAVQAEALPRSRWVGRDFDAAARAMHEGRAEQDLIHGEVSPAEARALHDDGVPALPLLVPFIPPDLAN